MVRRSLLPLLLLATLAARPLFAAANIVIVNSDPAGTGLHDPPLRASTVTIRVSASFASLSCSANSGVLGQTYPNKVYSDFSGAPNAATWYVKALADKFVGSDLDGTTVDITTKFNSSLGQAGCLTGLFFYLGLDNNRS